MQNFMKDAILVSGGDSAARTLARVLRHTIDGGDGRKLSCCSDQVQRAYAGQGRAGKQTRN